MGNYNTFFIDKNCKLLLEKNEQDFKKVQFALTVPCQESDQLLIWGTPKDNFCSKNDIMEYVRIVTLSTDSTVVMPSVQKNNFFGALLEQSSMVAISAKDEDTKFDGVLNTKYMDLISGVIYNSAKFTFVKKVKTAVINAPVETCSVNTFVYLTSEKAQELKAAYPNNSISDPYKCALAVKFGS